MTGVMKADRLGKGLWAVRWPGEAHLKHRDHQAQASMLTRYSGGVHASWAIDEGEGPGAAWRNRIQFETEWLGLADRWLTCMFASHVHGKRLSLSKDPSQYLETWRNDRVALSLVLLNNIGIGSCFYFISIIDTIFPPQWSLFWLQSVFSDQS